MFPIPSGCYRLPVSVRRRMAARSVVRFSPHISHISRSAGSFPWGGISFVRRQHSIGSTASSRWRTRCFCSINPISFLLLWTVQPSGKLYIGTRIAVKPESDCLPVLLLPHIVTRAGRWQQPQRRRPGRPQAPTRRWKQSGNRLPGNRRTDRRPQGRRKPVLRSRSRRGSEADRSVFSCPSRQGYHNKTCITEVIVIIGYCPSTMTRTFPEAGPSNSLKQTSRAPPR